MADTEAEEPLTKADMWATWQFVKAVLDFKRRHIEQEEAVDRMSYWSELHPIICMHMLLSVKRESDFHLLKAFPGLGRLPKAKVFTRRRARGRGTSRGSSRRSAET